MFGIGQASSAKKLQLNLCQRKGRGEGKRSGVSPETSTYGANHTSDVKTVEILLVILYTKGNQGGGGTCR